MMPPQPHLPERYPPEWFAFMRLSVSHGYKDVEHQAAVGSAGLATTGHQIDIAPSPLTRQRLQELGMILRQTPGGLQLLWRKDRAHAHSVRAQRVSRDAAQLPPEEASRLRNDNFGSPLLFSCSLRDPDFLNFTDYPDEFSASDGPLLLSNHLLTDASPAACKQLQLDWGRGATRAERTVVRRDQKAQREPVMRPLSAAAEERCRMQATSNAFALLDVHLDPGGTQLSSAKPRDGHSVARDSSLAASFAERHYQLRFEARRVHWIYNVLADTAVYDPASFRILDREGCDAGFWSMPPEEVDGERVTRLISCTPRAFKASSSVPFALAGAMRGPGARQRVLIPRLPAARPSIIRRLEAVPIAVLARAGTPTTAADIFVRV